MDFDKPKVHGDTSITDGLVILIRNLSYIVKHDYSVKRIRQCNVNVQSFIIPKMQTAPHLDGELRPQESAG